MTFKEKHLALLLAAASFAAVSCNSDSSEKQEQKQELGLLDPTPVPSEDFYGHDEVLYHTNIRVYDNKQKAFSDKYILTRAPKVKAEWPERGNEPTKVIPTKYNGSTSTVLVEVYKKDNVLVDHRGLSVINGNLEVVDPVNWEQNVQENDRKQKNYAKSLTLPNGVRVAEYMSDNGSLEIVEQVDSMSVDSVVSDSSQTKADSLTIFTEKQFLDSLQNSRE